jgi:hypothetical protein
LFQIRLVSKDAGYSSFLKVYQTLPEIENKKDEEALMENPPEAARPVF